MPEIFSSCRLFRSGASGLRSSCPSVARNSSFRLSAVRSASSERPRASRWPRIWYWRSRARIAVRTALSRVVTCSGRSSRVTLPSVRTASPDAAESAPGWVNTRTGRSDHGGWTSQGASEPRAQLGAPPLLPGSGSRQPRVCRSPSNASKRRANDDGNADRLQQRLVIAGVPARGSQHKHPPIELCRIALLHSGASRLRSRQDLRRSGRRSGRRGTRAATRQRESVLRPAGTRGSVRSCSPPRFFMTEIACRTSPRASKYRSRITASAR